VIEDDYLSELQLKGRAAPALASLDRGGRVIHIGTFSKTISPTLRLGFIVAPISLLSRFAEVAACLAPAPGPSVQLARPPSSSAKATTCAIFGVPSVPTPLSVTPCWSASSCTSKLPASRQRIGCAAAISRRRARHIHRQGNPGVWNGTSSFVNLVRTAGFRTIGASSGHRDGTKQASR